MYVYNHKARRVATWIMDSWPGFGPVLAGINTRYGINGQKKP